MNAKIKAVLIAILTVVVAVGLGAVIKHSASADDRPIVDPPCVPSDAWTETIEHPAVTHEETVVVQEAVDAVWANFQPNDNHAPFVGPPSYPSDPRGSWNVHNQIPGGHEGPDGVYSKGNPAKGGNWFYRQAAVEEVTETIVVVDEEAWTETIEHPAVVCEEEPTEEPTVPTEEPSEDPTDDPEPEEPNSDIGDAISAHSFCIDFDEVKTEHFLNGQLDHVTFRPARKADNCGSGPDNSRPVPSSLPERYAPEEGM